MDLETKMNIVDTINRNNINGVVPEEAEFGTLSLTGSIQKFYKFQIVNFNDGTTRRVLNYFGEQGGWHPSNFNTNTSELGKAQFVKIV